MHDDSRQETVQSQDFGKDEDKDQAEEQSWLLKVASDTCITHQPNGNARRQGAQANRKAGSQMQSTTTIEDISNDDIADMIYENSG